MQKTIVPSGNLGLNKAKLEMAMKISQQNDYLSSELEKVIRILNPNKFNPGDLAWLQSVATEISALTKIQLLIMGQDPDSDLDIGLLTQFHLSITGQQDPVGDLDKLLTSLRNYDRLREEWLARRPKDETT